MSSQDEPSSDRFQSFPTSSSRTGKRSREGFTLPAIVRDVTTSWSIHLKTRKEDTAPKVRLHAGVAGGRRQVKTRVPDAGGRGG